jgi:glycosyltransferase involved in cell wall biosynthesis
MPGVTAYSFVIPAFNEEACLAACIQSIQAQGASDIEIIVVDNGCTDRTSEIANELGCVVAREDRRGLSHARNRGAEAAQGEVVCFIDADGVLAASWLASARRCFADPNIGAASGLSVYVHPNPIKKVWYNLSVVFSTGGAWLSGFLFNHMLFNGNNLAMRRKLFLELGGYEPVIGEGLWLSRRLWDRREYRARMCPGMLLWNSSRGFEAMGFLRTLGYWVAGSLSRRSQAGYSYKSR